MLVRVSSRGRHFEAHSYDLVGRRPLPRVKVTIIER